MAARCVCRKSSASSALLLVLALWTLGVYGDGEEGGANPKISVGFLSRGFSGEEGEEAVATVKVDVPKDFDFGDSNESLTIVVTSEDGEAKALQDFDPFDGTKTLTREDLERIQRAGHDDSPGQEYVSVVISLTEDDYIEPSQTFTLTLEVQSALDVEEPITSATFTIKDREMNDKPKISFNQPSYTAYTSQNTPLTVTVLKTGSFRQNISVDVAFSYGPHTETICFEPSQNELSVPFDPGNINNTYSLSLALAESSRKFEKLVECGAPAEVKVKTFSPEGIQILKAVEEQLQDIRNDIGTDTDISSKYGKLQGDYEELAKKYEKLQEDHDKLQEDHDKLQHDHDKLAEEYQQDHQKLQKILGLAVWFEQNDYAVWESNKTLRVCLMKNMNTSKDLTVTVAADESSLASAKGNDAIIIAPQKIIIPAGNESACENISVTITDDSVALEDNETFTLTLAVDDHLLPVTSSATVTIMDDDFVEVSLTDNVLKPIKNNDVKVCVNKKNDFKGSLDIPLELSPADPSSEVKKATVTFKNPDTAQACVNVTIVPSDCPYQLKIGALPMDHVVAGNPATATVYAVFISFTEESYMYTAKEDADSVSVGVKALGKVAHDIKVDIIPKEGSPKELAGLNVGLTIPEDGNEGHADVPIKISEPFTVVLNNPPAGVHIVSPSEATVTPTQKEKSTDATDSAGGETDPMVYVWVVVVVIVLIVVVVAAYIIYHQRKKIKSCLALEEQGGKGRKGRYKKLPANIREALHQD